MTGSMLHRPGVRVFGTYMGVRIRGTVRSSRAHTVNHRRFEVAVNLDAESADALAALGYNAGRDGVAVVACGYDGESLASIGAGAAWDTDTLEVAE